MDASDLDHAWSLRKLPVAAAGLLDDSSDQRLRAHLEDCEECKENWLRFRASAEDTEQPHLSARMIARWDRAFPKLAGLERELVLQHLERCEECREELALAGYEAAAAPSSEIAVEIPVEIPSAIPTGTSGEPRDATRRPVVRRPGSFGGNWWSGFAVGAGMAAVAALLVVMLGETPEPPSGGGVLTWVVPSDARGGVMELPEGSRELALTVATPMDFDRSRDATIEVEDPAGRRLLLAELTPRDLSRSTIIVRVVGQPTLAAGTYELVMSQPREGGEPRVATLHFALAIGED